MNLDPKKIQKRSEMLNFFRQTAFQEIQKIQSQDIVGQLEKIFNITDKKRVLITIKESLGDIILLTSLLDEFRNKYPKDQYYIFLATEPKYFDVLDANSNIDAVIPWHPILENELLLMGSGNNKKFIDHFYYPAVQTQKFISYLTAK